MELKRIAIDTSKHVFTLHGVDASGRVVLRRNLRRAAFLHWKRVAARITGRGSCRRWGTRRC